MSSSPCCRLAAIHSSNQTKQVVKTLTDWTLRDPEELTASRRIAAGHYAERVPPGEDDELWEQGLAHPAQVHDTTIQTV